MSDSAPCITRCSGKDDNRLSITEITQHTTHKTRTKILECVCRAMKEFEIIQAFCYGIQSYGEIVCITDQTIHIFSRNVIKDSLSQIYGHISIRFFRQGLNLGHIHLRDIFRYEKTSVRSKAGKSCILQREGILTILIACTIIFHDIFCIKISRLCSE